MKNNVLAINSRIRSLSLLIVALMLSVLGASAQNSLPAPGFGGSFGPACNPGPFPLAAWDNPWNTGCNPSPSVETSPDSTVNNNANQGIMKVIANGYDAMGVWRVLPLLVSYQYDVVQYNVNVLNAWNPWTYEWDKGVNQQAFNTDYVLRNVTYDFYVPLSFGTFYFNL